MKTIKFLTAVLVAVLALSVSAYAQDKKKNKFEEVTFSVAIDCPNCQAKMDALIPHSIKGIKDYSSSLENQTVWFKYDPAKVTKQKIGAELAKLGYPGKEVKSEEPAK